ncbi:Talin-1, partial [Operophtera brumata]
MNEYMPEQYKNTWGIEKKVFKEYKIHQGLSEVDAKQLYTKTARALPTYGVTFFLVKIQQISRKRLK